MVVEACLGKEAGSTTAGCSEEERYSKGLVTVGGMHHPGGRAKAGSPGQRYSCSLTVVHTLLSMLASELRRDILSGFLALPTWHLLPFPAGVVVSWPGKLRDPFCLQEEISTRCLLQRPGEPEWP